MLQPVILAYVFTAMLHAHERGANSLQKWGQALGLPSCQSACNQCNSQQHKGLDFSSCPTGATSFGGMHLEGCSIGNWASFLKTKDFVPRGSSWKRNLGDLGGLLGGVLGGGGGGGGTPAPASGGSSGGVSYLTLT